MQLPGAPELGHLTYCTNIHAGESWPEVLAGLRRHLPPIKAAVAPDRPLGVGLRLSAEAAAALDDPAELAALRGFLDQHPDSLRRAVVLARLGDLERKRGDCVAARQAYERVLAGRPGARARRAAQSGLAACRAASNAREDGD